jgi:quercetin dioxygenase-like cupin family protein
VKIHRIFTLESGDSAVEIREVPLKGDGRPVSEVFEANTIFFRETPEGHVQDYHNAPRRQLIFITSGILELETSQGKRHIVRPGDILFTEDFEGKGHITRSLRDIRGFFHVTVPDSFEVTSWPLVKETGAGDSPCA